MLLVGAAMLRGMVLEHRAPAIGGDYRLHDSAGRAVSQSDFQSRYTLIYFGYTHCIDVCPLTLDIVSSALERLGARGAQVTPLFISVDPERDTPSVVGAYVERFSPRIVGLTGNTDELAPVLQAFHVTARRRPTDMPGPLQPASRMPEDAMSNMAMGGGSASRASGDPPAGSYLLDHSSVLYLMGPGNRLVALLPVDSGPGVLAAQLSRFLPEKMESRPLASGMHDAG